MSLRRSRRPLEDEDLMATPALSVQLYSVREALDADLPGALDRLAAIGFRNVEAFGFVGRAAELRAAYDAAGLAAPSGHAQFLSDQVRHGDRVIDVPPLETVLDEAETVGVELLIDPMIPADRWASADEVARTAERLNAAAQKAAERGIRVGYHNHSQEFHHSFDGVTAYETFAAQLSSDVALELDAFWAQVGGQDVPALITRLGGRVKALHVKDGPTGTDPFRAENFDPAGLGQVPAGEGEVALAEALDAAEGLELAVVEFDHYSGDIFDGIEGTVRYLNGRGIR
jgi:sugar phosphate isomerase/epimerase